MLVARIEPWQKNLILLWFASCLKFLQTQDIVINGETVELGRLFGKALDVLCEANESLKSLHIVSVP